MNGSIPSAVLSFLARLRGGEDCAFMILMLQAMLALLFVGLAVAQRNVSMYRPIVCWMHAAPMEG